MSEPAAPNLTDRVLHRDGLILVIDKPAGLPVHAGPGGGPHLEQGFAALRFGLPRDPALAHRLDADTSGCLVLGRHPKALRKLGRLFSQHKVEKLYWAVADSGPEAEAGEIAHPLAKRTDRRGWWMEVAQDGQRAVTGFEVLGRAVDGRCWLALTPRTGRTHQLRVHCAAEGWPLLGDPLYGSAGWRPGDRSGPGLHLHARAITLPLSASKPSITVEAPPPPHMRAALAACGWVGA